METTEKVKVLVKIDHGHTTCICKASNPKCDGKHCVEDLVTRDKYYGWKSTMNNRFGK